MALKGPLSCSFAPFLSRNYIQVANLKYIQTVAFQRETIPDITNFTKGKNNPHISKLVHSNTHVKLENENLKCFEYFARYRLRKK